METEEIEGKVKTFFSKGAKASKEAFEKVGDKVQDFSDRSVLKFEKKQLEGKREDIYLELGKKVSELLKSGAKLTSENAAGLKEATDLQKEIVSLSKQIAEKEKELND